MSRYPDELPPASTWAIAELSEKRSGVARLFVWGLLLAITLHVVAALFFGWQGLLLVFVATNLMWTIARLVGHTVALRLAEERDAHRR